MKHSFLWVVLAILAASNAWSIYKLRRSAVAAKEVEALAIVRKNELAACRSDFYTLKENVANAYKIRHTKPMIPASLDSLVRTGQQRLVLRVHQNNCNDCVDKSIKMLQEKRPDLFSSLLILADYPTPAAFFHDIGRDPSCPVIICRDFEPKDDLNSNPFYFTINSQRQIDNIIIPHWKMMDLFEHYIKEL
jgi:hypothetical protein